MHSRTKYPSLLYMFSKSRPTPSMMRQGNCAKLKLYMNGLIALLRKQGFSGELDDSLETRDYFSHDASMFELRPQLVASPKSVRDVERLVQFVAAHKKTDPGLSLTARSAGTDMAGGAINESIIVNFAAHFTRVKYQNDMTAVTEPGVFYRDFERETLRHGLLMPSYPASRELCQMGGLVANNSGGEKSLEYGKVEKFVKQLKAVLADGNEYTIKPLSKLELDKIMRQSDFEGKLYKRIYQICEDHYDLIKSAKPAVSKNSMGYGLWIRGHTWASDRSNISFGASSSALGITRPLYEKH